MRSNQSHPPVHRDSTPCLCEPRLPNWVNRVGDVRVTSRFFPDSRRSSEWSACLKRANERHRGLGLIRRRRAPTEAALFRLDCARVSGSSFKFCPKDALLSFELLRRQHGFLMANEAYLFGVLTPKAKRRESLQSVLIRSPGLQAIGNGAATVLPWPRSMSCRKKP